MKEAQAWLRVLISVWVLLPTTALADHVWDRWKAELHRQCPGRHVDWICDSCYDELIGGFTAKLPASTNQKLDRIADYSRRCAKEFGGDSCEMYVYLDSFEKMGLLKRFTAFGCQTTRCEMQAWCQSTGLPRDP